MREKGSLPDFSLSENIHSTQESEVSYPETETVPTAERFFEPVILTEVKRLVVPDGPCAGLQRISAKTEGSIIEQIVPHADVDEQRGELITKAEQQTSRLQPITARLLENDDFVENLAHKQKGDEITKGEIEQYLDIEEENLVDRTYLILNHNIDPELIPLVLKVRYVDQYHWIDPSVMEILEQSPAVRLRLAMLLIDPGFHKEFVSTGDGTPYSDEVQEKVQKMVEGILSEGKTLELLDETQTARTQYFLNTFLNVGRFYKWHQPEVAGLLDITLQDFTAEAYFDFELNKHGWSFNRSNYFHPQIKERLLDYASAAETGKYLVSLHKRVNGLYQKFFPEIYLDTKEEKLEIRDPRALRESSSAEQRHEEANGWYSARKKEIGIKSGTVIKAVGEEAFHEGTFYIAGPEAKRRVADALTMAHEKTHAIYETIKAIPGEYPDEDENYYQTADSAINEGFAVLTELIFIDCLKENPSLLNLDSDDILALEDCKQARLYLLKREKDVYAEGTYRILHKIYKEAAGPVSTRNVSQGLKAIREFIDNLDREKAVQTQRTDEEYKDLLAKGDPSEWRGFFGE